VKDIDIPSILMPASRHLANRQAGHLLRFAMTIMHVSWCRQTNVLLFWTVLLKKPLQLSHEYVP